MQHRLLFTSMHRRFVLRPSRYFAFYEHTCFSMFCRPRILLFYVEKKTLNKYSNPSNDHYNESRKIRNLERDSSVRLNSPLIFSPLFEINNIMQCSLYYTLIVFCIRSMVTVNVLSIVTKNFVDIERRI